MVVFPGTPLAAIRMFDAVYLLFGLPTLIGSLLVLPAILWKSRRPRLERREPVVE
jgi:hypothetical protein